MNNRNLKSLGQRDREFEELLCLAYLFTHSVCDETPDDVEFPLVDDTDLYQNYFCN
jgi:hypothetical protein